MKKLIQFACSLTALVFAFVVLSACQKLGGDKEENEISYPVSRLITDVNGRELQVDIVGRSADQISIVRKSDSSRFDLPISKLSAADQSFIKRLPLKAAPRVVAAAEDTENSTTPLFIQNRLDDIEEMKREIEFKKSEIKSKTLDPILTNSRRTQIRDLEKEIKRITLDIETYKRNNKL